MMMNPGREDAIYLAMIEGFDEQVQACPWFFQWARQTAHFLAMQTETNAWAADEYVMAMKRRTDQAKLEPGPSVIFVPTVTPTAWDIGP